MTQLTRRTLGASFGASLAALALPAVAQTRPVTLVVAFPPGGDVDVLARLYAEPLGARLGRSIVVENRSGASGTIGAMAVARAAPDGETLLLAPSTFAIAPHVLRRNPTYDPVADFTPVSMVGTATLILMASRQSGLRDLAGFAAAARAGRVTTYGSPGSGSPMNILGEMVNRAMGLQLTEVAYRGVAPVVNDLLSGTLAVGYVTPGVVIQHIRAGSLAPIAISERARNPVVPDVPSFAEAGHDIDMTAWYGLFGPRGLPQALVDTLSARMTEVLALPEVAERMRTLGMVTGGGAPSRLAQFNRADSDRFGRLVRDLGIEAS
ncbi:Bug family tripartite tricarboxylate transporter substrate binding protein [Falsiroseomonas oryziterrae]|uniref:Bug family tripartite tricarboxylate transporter substrate binding protein n=1 Tax=Falsiroseomonas oryziterrae TaxID=2911368 RepID=UPI001F334EA4|nr:tripartite tricarboxylate transporter substrate binding protein [Roseomonas sp. NPKOSM-4]